MQLEDIVVREATFWWFKSTRRQKDCRRSSMDERCASNAVDAGSTPAGGGSAEMKTSPNAVVYYDSALVIRIRRRPQLTPLQAKFNMPKLSHLRPTRQRPLPLTIRTARTSRRHNNTKVEPGPIEN